jgi:spore coat protein U-like protein
MTKYKTMKNGILAAAIVAGITTVASEAAFSQSSGTATANANATIVLPLILVFGQDLDFGTMIAGATPGLVTVPPVQTPVAVVAGGVTHLGGEASAIFRASGEPFATVNVTLTSLPATIDSPTDSMTIRDWLLSLNPGGGAGPSPQSGTLAPTGMEIIVGATIDVRANQPVGTYTNTFDLTVSYN